MLLLAFRGSGISLRHRGAICYLLELYNESVVATGGALGKGRKGEKGTVISTLHSLWARWQTSLLQLPRFAKRGILVGLDFSLLTLALWLPLSLRYTAFYIPPDLTTALLLFSAPLVTVVTFALSGLYKLVTRYLGYRGHTRIIGSIWLSVLIWSLILLMSGQSEIGRAHV